ncbi:MAG: hypothetical protein ACE5FA_00320 [Dehalococcoidia bacterium]
MARNDFLKNRGTTLVDDTNDLLPESVGGQRTVFAFAAKLTTSGTASGDPLFSPSVDANAAVTNTSVPMPKAGSVVGLAVRLGTAITHTTQAVTVTVFNGATAMSTASINLVSADRAGYTNANKDATTFSAGDLISVKVLHAAKSPAAISAYAWVHVEM